MIDFFIKSSIDEKALCESYSSFSDWIVPSVGVFITGTILSIIAIFIFAFWMSNQQRAKNFGISPVETSAFKTYIIILVFLLLLYIPYKLYSDVKELPIIWKCETGVFYDSAMFIVPISFLIPVLILNIIFIKIITTKHRKHKEVSNG